MNFKFYFSEFIERTVEQKMCSNCVWRFLPCIHKTHNLFLQMYACQCEHLRALRACTLFGELKNSQEYARVCVCVCERVESCVCVLIRTLRNQGIIVTDLLVLTNVPLV